VARTPGNLLRTVPPSLVEHAREYAEGTRTPAEPRNASTVVLLRDGETATSGALEVYFLRRHVRMDFAAGMFVFPGGGVDPRDFDQEVDWVGPDPAQWAGLLGTDEALARALVCAAVRETFEESGVLFAGTTHDTVVGDTTGPDWEEDRRRLEARELSFTDFLRRRRLKLRADLLRVWGSWVTPVFEPKRFRAWFFVAELPAGQRTRDVSTESDHVAWLSVREAITAVDEGEILMLPPTYCTCLEIFDATTARQVLKAAADRDQEPVEPTAVLDGEQVYLTVPDRLLALGEDVGRRMRS